MRQFVKLKWKEGHDFKRQVTKTYTWVRIIMIILQHKKKENYFISDEECKKKL